MWFLLFGQKIKLESKNSNHLLIRHFSVFNIICKYKKHYKRNDECVRHLVKKDKRVEGLIEISRCINAKTND